MYPKVIIMDLYLWLMKRVCGKVINMDLYLQSEITMDGSEVYTSNRSMVIQPLTRSIHGYSNHGPVGSIHFQPVHGFIFKLTGGKYA